MPSYLPADHLRELCTLLEAVERGEIKRLSVSMSPRHGKSLLCAIMFPVWALARDPHREIIQCGHTKEFVLKHSRHARNLFASQEACQVFPESCSPHVRKHGVTEWGTNDTEANKGGYYAVGVGGAVVGRGADIAVIDDPYTGRAQAESETVRAGILDWYRSELYERLSPDGAIIYLMTRWHEADLAGYLLKEEMKGGEKWVRLVLPAITPTGEACWPERWDLDYLKRVRGVIGAYEWACQYLQEPTVRGGNVFVVDKIQIHPDASSFPQCRHVRFWDLASTQKERVKDDPDYSAGAKVGITKQDGAYHLWIPDCVVGQWEAPERNKRIAQTAAIDGPGVAVAIESVGGYKDTWAYFRDLLKGKATVHKITVANDKPTRAMPLEPIFEAGNVHIVRAEWNHLFIQQFTAFPGGGHDDIVDAVAGGYTWLTRMAPGRATNG